MNDFFSGVRRLVAVFIGACVGFVGLYLVITGLGWAEPMGFFPVIVDPELPGSIGRGLWGLSLLAGGLFVLFAGLFVRTEPRVFKLGREGLTVNHRVVRELVEHRAEDVAGVSHCRVRGVRMADYRWRIRCELDVAEGVGLEQTSAEVENKVRESLEQFTGVPVESVDVTATQALPG